MTRDINVNPYPEMIADYNNGLDGNWIETNQETYQNQLGAVPPAAQNRGAFMVGEPFTHANSGVYHAVFVSIAGRYFCTYAPLAHFDADLYRAEIVRQFNIEAGKDGFISNEKHMIYTGAKHEAAFYSVLKNVWSSDIFNAVTFPGDSIRLTGTFFNMVKPVRYDITFKVGDQAEYDSYNLRYIGKIVSIAEKTVTVEHGYGQKERTRLTLANFAHKNFNFDLARIQAENAIESQCI